MRRVVITGLGALTPIGNNLADYLHGLQNGISGANLITHFDASKFKTQFACELKNFVAEDLMDRREVRKLDKFTVYAMIAAAEAVQHAGLDVEKLNLDRAGVYGPVALAASARWRKKSSITRPAKCRVTIPS